MPVACTMRDLYVSWNASPTSATTFTVRVNAADTALACTISTSGTACNNTVSLVAVVAGDKIVLRVTGPATLPTATSGALAIQGSWRCNYCQRQGSTWPESS
jgi:hypothetical protein